MEKFGKMAVMRIWPDWGNTTRADMAGLGSIGLKAILLLSGPVLWSRGGHRLGHTVWVLIIYLVCTANWVGPIAPPPPPDAPPTNNYRPMT